MVVARDWTVPTTTANERQPMAFYLCLVITSGVLLKMEVGIRKGAWRRAWRYPTYLWSLRWVYGYTLSKKPRRLVYGVYPRIPPQYTTGNNYGSRSLAFSRYWRRNIFGLKDVFATSDGHDWSYSHTLTGGFNFQRGVSCWYSAVGLIITLNAPFVSYGRGTDGQTDGQ